MTRLGIPGRLVAVLTLLLSVAAVASAQAPNKAPTVTLAAPASAAPKTTVTLKATAKDADGSITRYEFSLDGKTGYEVSRPASAGGANTATFTMPETNRTVSVRVTDNRGATAIDSAVVRRGGATPTPTPATPTKDLVVDGEEVFEVSDGVRYTRLVLSAEPGSGHTITKAAITLDGAGRKVEPCGGSHCAGPFALAEGSEHTWVGEYTTATGDAFSVERTFTVPEGPASIDVRPKVRVRARIGRVRARGSALVGRLKTAAPCMRRRRVVLKHAGEVLARTRTRGRGRFRLETTGLEGQARVVARAKVVRRVKCNRAAKRVTSRAGCSRACAWGPARAW